MAHRPIEGLSSNPPAIYLTVPKYPLEKPIITITPQSLLLSPLTKNTHQEVNYKPPLKPKLIMILHLQRSVLNEYL